MNLSTRRVTERATSHAGAVSLALAGLVLLLLPPSPVRAQLTLRDALREADRSAYGNRIAAGTAGAQHAQVLASLEGVLPNVRFEAGYVRTTDPIAVFGATLRQRTITQANFDPQRLNFPSALGNYQSAFIVEQPLLNADAWAGRRAALHAAGASRAVQEWTRLSTRADVVRAYYGTVLATERVATLQTAARAAHAHAAQADAMVKQGLVTKSDALLAAVRAEQVDAQLAEARGGAATALRQLAVMVGRDGSAAVDLGLRIRLPSTEHIRAAVAGDTAVLLGQTRSDVRAATEGMAAARTDALRARSTLLPRLNGFARYDWNSASGLYAGDHNWTVGVMASWSPFGGPSKIADIQATAGRAAAADAQADAASANARLDVEQTRIALGVALTQLEIAERAATQSAEAHRIVSRKYEGGLASVVELLDAQAVETQSALALSQARWATIAADAARRLALGIDPATLASLDDADPVAARDAQPNN
jgi:outer membrane protein TolC